MKRLLFAIWLLFCAPIQVAACPNVNHFSGEDFQILNRVYYQKAFRALKTLSLNDKTFGAALKVLETYRVNNEAPPIIRRPDRSHQISTGVHGIRYGGTLTSPRTYFDRLWLANLLDLERNIRVEFFDNRNNQKLLVKPDYREGNDGAFIFDFNNTKYVFLPTHVKNYILKPNPRLTYAAYVLSQMLNIDVTPKVTIAQIKRVVGLLIKEPINRHPPVNINPHSLSDNIAFAFLISHPKAMDSAYADSLGVMRVSDYQSTFQPGIPAGAHADESWGRLLPDIYSPRMAEAARSLSFETLAAPLKYVLNPQELAGLKFRWHIIQMDAFSHPQ